MDNSGSICFYRTPVKEAISFSNDKSIFCLAVSFIKFKANLGSDEKQL